MWYWYFLFGCVFGGLVYSLIVLQFGTSGTLHIDRTDPQKDVYRLDINKLDDLSKARRIVLKVKPNSHLSQR